MLVDGVLMDEVLMRCGFLRRSSSLWATPHLKNPQSFSLSSKSFSLIRESIRLLDPIGVTTPNRVGVTRHVTTGIDFAAVNQAAGSNPHVLSDVLMFFGLVNHREVRSSSSGVNRSTAERLMVVDHAMSFGW